MSNDVASRSGTVPVKGGIAEEMARIQKMFDTPEHRSLIKQATAAAENILPIYGAMRNSADGFTQPRSTWSDILPNRSVGPTGPTFKEPGSITRQELNVALEQCRAQTLQEIRSILSEVIKPLINRIDVLDGTQEKRLDFVHQSLDGRITCVEITADSTYCQVVKGQPFWRRMHRWLASKITIAASFASMKWVWHHPTSNVAIQKTKVAAANFISHFINNHHH